MGHTKIKHKTRNQLKNSLDPFSFKDQLNSYQSSNNNLRGKIGEGGKVNDCSNKQLLDPVLFIQEQERKRIAEALHNEVGQIFYAIQLSLSGFEIENLTEGNRKIKMQLEALVSEGINATKNISFELMPPLLKDYGLSCSIAELCKRHSTPSLNFKCNLLHTGSRYNDLFETAIFRIAQELINNIVKHSRASEAEITVSEEGPFLVVRARDNGVGFETSGMRKCGLGLHYIQNRVKQLHGDLQISSGPQEGTIVHIKILLP